MTMKRFLLLLLWWRCAVAFVPLLSPSAATTTTTSTPTSSTLLHASNSKTTMEKKQRNNNKNININNKKKKGGKKIKLHTPSSASTSTTLSEEDLADHVAHLYIYGPGGVLQGQQEEEEEEEEQEQQHEQDEQHNHNHNHNKNKLNGRPALVLNADYQPLSYLPLSVWTWQEAVKSIFSGKVTVVDVYPDVTVRAASLEIPLPSVIALNEYVPQYSQTPAFTKRNVFLRDEYKCQYCNDRFHTKDLSLDHVVPRKLGGRLTWDNAVTSCKACNGKKGCLTLHQLSRVGMKLLQPPRLPTQYELHKTASRMVPRRVHKTWEPYLGRNHQKNSSSKNNNHNEKEKEEHSGNDTRSAASPKTIHEKTKHSVKQREAVMEMHYRD